MFGLALSIDSGLSASKFYSILKRTLFIQFTPLDVKYIRVKAKNRGFREKLWLGLPFLSNHQCLKTYMTHTFVAV